MYSLALLLCIHLSSCITSFLVHWRPPATFLPLPSHVLSGLWSASLQDVGVNGQCGDILTSKRFMLDMLYAHNRKSTEDEEKGDGEPGRSAQEVEAVASLATRISTLQANSQAPEESIKRVDIGCLDNRGSVKAFAEKFNSGEVGQFLSLLWSFLLNTCNVGVCFLHLCHKLFVPFLFIASIYCVSL